MKIYLSFLDESNLILDGYIYEHYTGSDGGQTFTDTNEDTTELINCTYSWVVDENGKRTGLTITRNDELSGIQILSTLAVKEVAQEGDSSNFNLILTMDVPEESHPAFEGKITLTFRQKTTSPHTHTYKNCAYSISKYDNSIKRLEYHSAETTCAEHEKLSIEGCHVYDNESSTTCSICGLDRVYFIRYYTNEDITVPNLNYDTVKINDTLILPEKIEVREYVFSDDKSYWESYPIGTCTTTKYTDIATGKEYSPGEKLAIDKDMNFVLTGTIEYYRKYSGGDNSSNY